VGALLIKALMLILLLTRRGLFRYNSICASLQ
jgi:hypothetical protein